MNDEVKLEDTKDFKKLKDDIDLKLNEYKSNIKDLSKCLEYDEKVYRESLLEFNDNVSSGFDRSKTYINLMTDYLKVTYDRINLINEKLDNVKKCYNNLNREKEIIEEEERKKYRKEYEGQEEIKRDNLSNKNQKKVDDYRV